MNSDIFTLSTLALLSIISLARTQSDTCYDKTGVESSVLFPCDPSAAESGCCEQGEVCYSNGMCGPRAEDAASAITPLFWHGCTDPSFNASSCLDECMAYSGNGIQSCSNIGVGYYCCYGVDGCDCTLGDVRVFSLPAATIITTVASTGIATSSSRSSATTTVNTSVTTGSADATRSSVASSTSEALPADSSNNKVAIGVGVGAGIAGVAIIAAVVFFIARRIRQGKQTPKWQNLELDAQPQPNQHYGNPNVVPQELDAKRRQSWRYGDPGGPVELDASGK